MKHILSYMRRAIEDYDIMVDKKKKKVDKKTEKEVKE